MFDVPLLPRMVRMPEFAPGDWINSPPMNKASLHGRVILIDFWDYTCINCIRTFPYLKQWHARYQPLGLTIIGVHTPEFKFAHLRTLVEQSAAQHELAYPILLDNQYQNWTGFANKAWPSKYLVDPDGYIRYHNQGEGRYRQTEQAIQTLLRQRHDSILLPDLLPPLRDEDRPGAICYRPTPELYAGYQGGGLFGGALGNSEGYVPQNPMFYELPQEMEEGRFYLEGVWRAGPECMGYAGQEGGRILLPYRAMTVNAVLSPSADIVEVALSLLPPDSEPVIEVRQDGRFLSPLDAGSDILFANDGTSYVRVDSPRRYQLVRNPDYGAHQLELIFQAPSLALCAFTFTSCATAGADGSSYDTYQVR